MIPEQLRQILRVSVSNGPLEVSWIELCFFSFVYLWFSCRGLSIFFVSLSSHFDFLFLNNWLSKLFPLLIFKRSWLNTVLEANY